jgi:hypothetical protein
MVSESAKTLWEEVKANHAKLRACKGSHDFVADETDAYHNSAAAKRRKCTRCGGTMDSINASYYGDGLAHGLKSVRSAVAGAVAPVIAFLESEIATDDPEGVNAEKLLEMLRDLGKGG